MWKAVTKIFQSSTDSEARKAMPIKYLSKIKVAIKFKGLKPNRDRQSTPRKLLKRILEFLGRIFIEIKTLLRNWVMNPDWSK